MAVNNTTELEKLQLAQQQAANQATTNLANQNLQAQQAQQAQIKAAKAATNPVTAQLNTKAATQKATVNYGSYKQGMDALLKQLSNYGDFSYEFNSDPMFRQYADWYTQMGKQANLNAQGEAAALTGGYGNSYAESAGQQAYQQYLTALYDKGMELRDDAYQKWAADRDNLYNLYNAYGSAYAQQLALEKWEWEKAQMAAAAAESGGRGGNPGKKTPKTSRITEMGNQIKSNLEKQKSNSKESISGKRYYY